MIVPVTNMIAGTSPRIAHRAFSGALRQRPKWSLTSQARKMSPQRDPYSIGGIRHRVHEFRERLGNAEIDSGHAPHHHEQKQPEPECAVQVPVEALPPAAQAHAE